MHTHVFLNKDYTINNWGLYTYESSVELMDVMMPNGVVAHFHKDCVGYWIYGNYPYIQKTAVDVFNLPKYLA